MKAGRATFGFLSVALLCWTSCTPPSNEGIDASFIHIPGEGDVDRAPHMTWNATHLDLGLLAAGEQRRLTYTVTNDGQAPLLLAQVLPSCGCTIAEDWDTAPIPPGAQRDLVLLVEAGERTETLNEKATVVTNAVPASIELTFTARVLGPDRAPDSQP